MIIQENTKQALNDSKSVAALISSLVAMTDSNDQEREQFYTILLDAKNKVKAVDLLSMGTLTGSLISPMQTYRLAVQRGAASIICGHQHPSGDPTPSKDDIAVTTRLKQAGEILGIQLLDHVIVGTEGQYSSLREKGIL